MFRARPVPHPRVRRRQRRGVRRSPIARGGLQFMLDHLAAGDLAAAARLRLQPDAAVGRHLPAAADRRLPVSGPDVRDPVRPLRRARLRHRRHGRVRRQLHRPDAAAGRLPLLGVRAADRRQRHRRRHVRRPELVVDHEQRPGRGSAASASGMRSTFQNSGTALSIGVVLLADDRRAGRAACRRR